MDAYVIESATVETTTFSATSRLCQEFFVCYIVCVCDILVYCRCQRRECDDDVKKEKKIAIARFFHRFRHRLMIHLCVNMQLPYNQCISTCVDNFNWSAPSLREKSAAIQLKEANEMKRKVHEQENMSPFYCCECKIWERKKNCRKHTNALDKQTVAWLIEACVRECEYKRERTLILISESTCVCVRLWVPQRSECIGKWSRKGIKLFVLSVNISRLYENIHNIHSNKNGNHRHLLYAMWCVVRDRRCHHNFQSYIYIIVDNVFYSWA